MAPPAPLARSLELGADPPGTAPRSRCLGPTALTGARYLATSEGTLRHPEVRPPQWVHRAHCDPTTRRGALVTRVGVLGFSAAEVWTTV